jgi:hypothetical protein
MSHKKAGQKYSIKMANRSFEGVAKFKYFGTTLTDQNYIQEETESRLNSGNAYYNSVQSVLSSCLLLSNVKVKIYKSIILPFVLYGCKSWSLTLSEEHRLSVFENRVLRIIFGPKQDEVQENVGSCTVRIFIFYTPLQILHRPAVQKLF